jgi:predicted PurR-regulated permease PerM
MQRLPALSVLSLIAIVAVPVALWLLGGTLMIAFVAVLLAAVLDAAILGLRYVLPVPRVYRFVLVCVAFFVGIGFALAYGGPTIVTQFNMLIDMIEGQRERLGEFLASIGALGNGEEDGTRELSAWLPSVDSLFSHAGMAFGMTLGVVGNTLVIVFLGVFLASDPGGYRDGIVRLFPVHYRPRLTQVFEMAGAKLRWWIVSQLALMVLIGVATWAMLQALGIENAVLLGVVTGSLNFIPYLGPILAAIPIIFAILGEEPVIIFTALGLYVAIQNIEGYIVAPLVQKRVVKLPPAWSMLTLAIMGTLFGAMGIAVAIPLFAVARIFVRELYIKDVLERAPDEPPVILPQSTRPTRLPSASMR